MIKLKLSFGDNQPEKTFDIKEGDNLQVLVERICADVPLIGDAKLEEMFNVVLNGELIVDDMWDLIVLKTTDNVLVTPKIQDGDAGQLFKQALLITVSVIASVYLSPAVGGGVLGGLAVAGATMGAALLLNALIPPPSLDVKLDEQVQESQMYTVSGQSNKVNRLGVVPKVYGTHRIFPPLAAIPYTEISTDPDTGEMIQTFYAIYDFGLGSPLVSDLKIGDTPLTTDSFKDFSYRFVDINKPDTNRDQFDEVLNKNFTLYKGDRTFTQLSHVIEDGGEVIENTDDNPDSLPQEIVVDLVCPKGLYAYSSGGDKGERRITITLEFAPVGTSNWNAYNDLDYVDDFRAIGGTDYTDFPAYPVALHPDHPLFSTYYTKGASPYTGSYNSGTNIDTRVIFKNDKYLLVKKPTATDNFQWNVGAKVLCGGSFFGIITDVTDLGPTYNEWYRITLDRNITFTNIFYPILAYLIRGTLAYNSSTPSYEIANIQRAATLISSRHQSGAAVIQGDSTSPVYSTFKFKPKTAGQYKVRIKRISTDSTFSYRVEDELVWAGLTTAFDNDPIKTTKRHVFLELKIRATDQLSGNIQNLSGIASQPVEVYDPDTETWSRELSNNPAWVFVDLLTNEINKKSVAVSRLHLESILDWADYCDEVPTPPPGGDYLEPRFQCNFIFDYAATLQEVIQQICSSAQASLNIIDGKYGILLDRTKTVPVQIFTPRNSREFSSSRFYAPRPHALKVKYIDPQLAWEISECVVYDNGYDETSAEEFEEITAFGCTNYEQAWRYGRYMLAQNRLRQETISILVDFENLICTRGDYVVVAQDVMQVGGRPARVKGIAGNVVTIDDGLDVDTPISWGYTYRSALGEISTSTCTPLSARTFELDGNLPEVGDLIVIGEVGQITIDCIVKSIAPNDDLSAQLILVERANEIFEAESTNELPSYDPQLSTTSNPDFAAPRAITNLTLGDVTWELNAAQSGYSHYAEITWDTPQGSIFEFFEVWLNDGRGYRSMGNTVAKYWKQYIDNSRLGTEHGLKVVAVAASGKKLELIAMPEVLFTPEAKTTAPSDVSGFGMSITNQVLQLSWQPVTDVDIYKYEIRYSPEVNDIWEASVPLQLVDRNVNSIAVQARTGIYFIKAIDFALNKSETAAAAYTTIPNLFDLNVVETLDDAPNFLGLLDQAALLGEAVILEELVVGTVDTMQFYTDGYYYVEDLVDLGDIYSVRLQSLIRADGYRFGELMSEWESLEEVEHLNSAETDEWNIVAEYRATNEILSMSSWLHLYDVAHLNEGLGQGFTDWRPIPTIGDATGRVFQFRIHLQSITPNVTPRLFDGTIKLDMPDRQDSFENLTSDAVTATQVTYSQRFYGPDDSPNVQISIDGAQSGDYWTFANKNLEGFQIRFFNSSNVQVVRQFDVLAKGYGKRHTVTL